MSRLALAAVAVVSLAPSALAQQHEHRPVTAEQLGQLSFPTSCAPEVQEGFERAVALLHSFWYQAAERAFRTIAGADPRCAMAHWGVAMSRFHQLWENPRPEDLTVARAALEKARAAESTSERERAYIAALERFYRDASEVGHLERALAYEKAMGELHERYPEDTETGIFHALSLLAVASASPPDPAFARQEEVLAILEPILHAQPNHPGVAHYIIHASDYPPLAQRGLEAARSYAEITPDAPHALHMPSHIFTRLGLWEESIASNRAASAAAREDGWIGEELHTTDYMVYAYLQGARDREAAQLVEALPARTAELSAEDTNYWAGLYAAAATPARYAVERRRWREAAALEVSRDVLPGGIWCWTEGPLHLARGLGAAHTGDLAGARRSMKELEACRKLVLETDERRLPVPVPFWAGRLEVQRHILAARLALAEGRDDEALALLRSAADLEDAAGKPILTPGFVVPARELLAQTLLEQERPSDALVEFERSLQASVNRFQSLYGAARAAELAGELERARGYYGNLLEIGRSADVERPELREARRFLARDQAESHERS